MMIVDLFAGPGGWDHGAAALDLHPLGYELDKHACATREAAGLHTVNMDVTEAAVPDSIDGLIASPPCQDFSSAGTKAGRAGERGQLIDIVPRWVDAARPRWIACEQVPEAVEVWKEHAHHYRALSYRTWVGILNAADYGVPSTRRRAFLLAHLDHPVGPPEPTHAEHPAPQLFGPTLEPWVTAADAGVPGIIDRRQQNDGTPVAVVDGNTRPAPTVTGTAVGQWLIDGEVMNVAQAAALQTFPADYPWQGNKGQQGTQVGNAVPPRLAMHVLAAVTGLEVPATDDRRAA